MLSPPENLLELLHCDPRRVPPGGQKIKPSGQRIKTNTSLSGCLTEVENYDEMCQRIKTNIPLSCLS